ncbi:MAG: SDR family oxidoreductase [Dehalococcoidales bacterium]|nr:SDR family oxidoreductase [Dehalococcoidales bacterium]
MGDRLKGKVAVVTGSGRGIGRGIALLMASEGAKVVVNDLGAAVTGAGASQSPAEEVVSEIKKMGGEAVANFESVATVEGGESIIKTAVDKFGRLDILVNNAGILRDRMIFNMAPEEWDAVLKVHLYGTFNCTRPASIVMRQQRWGRIISMTSTSGVVGNSGQANYGAAKMGIVGFTFVCARDLGKYGITCNAVAPSAGTRMTLSDEVMAARQIRAQRGLTAAAPAPQAPREAAAASRGPADPEDVAPLVCYLATEQASGVNGRIFFASGGNISLYSNPEPIRSLYKIGRWTLDELMTLAPRSLTQGLVNPAPAQPAGEEKK